LKKTYSNSIRKSGVSDDMLPRESLIQTVAQLSLDVCADVCAESASAGARMIRLQALANDFPVPLRHRNLLRGRSNPVPERLHKIDLLIDREIVKPWRRSGAYLGHGKTPTSGSIS
jgi:hypothetical protein